MLLRGEDDSEGIRNAETASVIGWFMEETWSRSVHHQRISDDLSFIPDSPG
jgi:hypothetical protein